MSVFTFLKFMSVRRFPQNKSNQLRNIVIFIVQLSYRKKVRNLFSCNKRNFSKTNATNIAFHKFLVISSIFSFRLSLFFLSFKVQFKEVCHINFVRKIYHSIKVAIFDFFIMRFHGKVIADSFQIKTNLTKSRLYPCKYDLFHEKLKALF